MHVHVRNKYSNNKQQSVKPRKTSRDIEAHFDQLWCFKKVKPLNTSRDIEAHFDQLWCFKKVDLVKLQSQSC